MWWSPAGDQDKEFDFVASLHDHNAKNTKKGLPPSPPHCKTKPCVHIDDASLQTVDFITS